MATRRSVLAAFAGIAAGGLSGKCSPALARIARFGVDGDNFVLDGARFQILAGEMHYPRIPRASWRDRFRKLKALGLNTLTTYVFWNAHEPKPGQYDFSGNLDLVAYLRMAQDEGLWVNLRPGPYVCAEWDGGGLPAWLFPSPDVRARSTDPRYMDPVTHWLARLGQELSPLLIDNGGPIILTQIENEYGAFGEDQGYLEQQRQALRKAGFDGLLYTADPAEFFAKGSISGIVGGINFGTNYSAEKEFATRGKVRSEGPYFCSELWGGWYDSYGKGHETMPAAPLVESLKWMLERKYSISFYMLQGGTSWAFTPGANWNAEGYQPDVTSYDYDALFDEAGRPTVKFDAVQALFRHYLPAQAFGTMPAPEPSIALPRFLLTETAPLSQLLGAGKMFASPRTLEDCGQAHGMMLYRHKCKMALKGDISFDDVRDYALVRSHGTLLAVLDRRFSENDATVEVEAGANLDLLVDTMGHCNYGKNIGKDQKGIIGEVMFSGKPLTGWEHYELPLDDISSLRFAQSPVNGPAFYRGHFQVSQPGFTFLDTRGWGKGYVWINGHNAGRYWSAGPQESMFVPAEWLNEGANEIVVLDLLEGGERSLSASPHPVWELISPT